MSLDSTVQWTGRDVFIHIISFTKTDKNGVLFRTGNFIPENLRKSGVMDQTGHIFMNEVSFTKMK